MPRLAVPVSGVGSLIEPIHKVVPIDLVIADRECRALAVARAAGIRTVLVERTDFGPSFDRDGYTERVLDALASEGIDLIAMAGFMTLFSARMFDAYPDRILNTHPSLLPEFKGAHAVRDALRAGVAETGCTIHHATLGVDEGPIIAQYRVPILPGDDEQSLHGRIKQVERKQYPLIIKQKLSELA